MRAVLTLVLVGAISQGLLATAQSNHTTYRMTGSRIAIGQDVKVEADEEVNDAVIAVGGSASIDGRVREGVIVAGGDVHLGPHADVFGDIMLVGGHLTREEGAKHAGRVNYVSFGDWSGRAWFLPRVTVGEFARWIGLAGTIARVSLLAVLMGFMLLVARTPVARVGRAAAAEPLRAVVVGLAAEIFFIPMLVALSIAMAVTIIGIPFLAIVIPVALVVAFFAMILGYTALACRLGEWLEDLVGWRPGSAFLATGLGLLLIVGPTLVARLVSVASGSLGGSWALSIVGMSIEFLVWTVGLGAAIMTGLGRWHTAPPPIAVEG